MNESLIGQEDLEKIAEGLEKLKSKFKRNENKDDTRRLEQTEQALTSIRKVILNVAVNGGILGIVPIRIEGIFGWQILMTDNSTKTFVDNKKEKNAKSKFV